VPNQRFAHLAALSGILGPLLFAAAVAGLTFAQYDFMRSLGWHPLRAPTFDWPSGLSLGPQGGWMTLTFIVVGALMSLFALGLRTELDASKPGRIGTGLLALAGIALCGLAFATDPTLRTTPVTWHGRLHDLSFVLLGLTLLPGALALGLAFRRDPLWRDLSAYTLLTVTLALPAFWLKGAAFYGFLAAILIWSEVIAIRLSRLTRQIHV
jgi:hypothetical protein